MTTMTQEINLLENAARLLRESSAELARVADEKTRLRAALKPFAEIGRGDRFGATAAEWQRASAVYTNTSDNGEPKDTK
jgi:hypothetical protein